VPHLRERYSSPLIQHALSHSSIVGLVGQRQVGKTTLAERVGAEYVTFDQQRELVRATQDPDTFIQDRKAPFTIDECQLCPPLFPALKDWVRTHPKKGQFLLTGSIRFTSRKAIRESLTGRISYVEVLPLTLSESHRRPLGDLFARLQSSPAQRQIEATLARAETHSWCKAEMLREYLTTGGLPGICFQRSAPVRLARWEDHLATLLDRDLRQVLQTTLPFPVLRGLLALLAETQGEPMDLSRLSRKTRISRVTLPKLLYAFEAIFLIRSYATSGTRTKPVYYLEDQGMATYLMRQSEAGPLGLTDLNRLLHSCILPQFRYRPEIAPGFKTYRTRNGVEVPFVVETQQGSLALIPELDSNPGRVSIEAARAFLKKSAHSSKRPAQAVILTQGTRARILAPDLLSIPMAWGF
jgi:predicted AAA+ superfamily ATPase